MSTTGTETLETPTKCMTSKSDDGAQFSLCSSPYP
jgi:hypothetical protein